MILGFLEYGEEEHLKSGAVFWKGQVVNFSPLDMVHIESVEGLKDIRVSWTFVPLTAVAFVSHMYSCILFIVLHMALS